MAKNTLTVTDNRTGQTIEIPITDGTIRALDLRQLKTGPDDFGMMTYDPAFTNTASCRSAITYIDGDKGVLQYRGYDIAELAENCNFLQVAYLIVQGDLPSPAEEKQWIYEINRRMFVFENIKKFMDGFRYDAHPMGMLISTVAALSTFYPSSKNVRDRNEQFQNICRLIGKVPIIAAYAYRHRKGLPYINPDPDLTYTENFMNMLWRRSELKFLSHPVLARALDVLWILHADHEQNCSANAMRAVGSSEADPYVCTAAAAAALSGPLHGGANEEVLLMLDKIGSKANVAEYIKGVKEGKYKLMGFGHRVYKNYDPRAKIIKRVADEVFKVTGRNPKIDIAVELEQIALNDEYFIKRKLYPNVDFYSGIIYQAMGFTPDMFTVMFAIPRTVGWLAQWREMVNDPEQKIARPRQIYTGAHDRHIEGAPLVADVAARCIR
jgi:citrate synthase